MSKKQKKTEDFYANTLKGKDLEDFKKKFYGKEPLFPEKMKRANEIIKKTKFLED